jgi:C_GCAxxG_C_C family probable redox protein
MTRAEEAAKLIATSQMNCAQAVVSVFAQEIGLDRSTALKASLPFGAGMGRTSGVCGAASGAYMVLGLRLYPGVTSPSEHKEKVYSLVQEFNRRFKALHKSINCTDLISCDLSTTEGRAKARDNQSFSTTCPRFVADAVTILETLK